MKISVAIMAHRKRSAVVADLVERLGIEDDRVVWDRRSDRWDTGVRAWRHHDPAADWHLVLQDDAMPCRDLLPGLEAALDHIPAQSVVSLYLGSNGPRSLAAHDPSWITFPRLIWGVGIAVPVASIDDMLTWCEQNPQPNYDTRVARYYERAARWPVYYTWPSLVDHRQVASLLNHPNGRRARDFIGGHISALDWPPAYPNSRPAVPDVPNKKEGAPMGKLLIAARNAVVVGRNAAGRRTQQKIKEGKLYRSDDPIVQGREHLFSPVEDMTAAPGEKRSIRRPRKQAEAATQTQKSTAPANKSAAPSETKTESE